MRSVEEFMNAGWAPMGGPVVVGCTVFQAVATDMHFDPSSGLPVIFESARISSKLLLEDLRQAA